MTQYQQEQFPLPTPSRLRRELHLRRPPWWMVIGFILVIIGTWVPLYLIYQRRSSYSALPKIHYIQDMDFQPGYRTQAASALFADGRAARHPVAGTVARGHLREDDHYYRGFHSLQNLGVDSIEFFSTFPDAVRVDDRFIDRGAERFAIYCAVCHGATGFGDGIVHQRAVALKETKWVPPTNLLTQEIRDRAEGQIFQAISDGVRNMPGYKTQINVADRWAIVAFVRRLQATHPVAIVEKPSPPK